MLALILPIHMLMVDGVTKNMKIHCFILMHILTYNNQFGDFSLNAVLGASYQRADYGVGISVDTGTQRIKVC